MNLKAYKKSKLKTASDHGFSMALDDVKPNRRERRMLAKIERKKRGKNHG